MYCCRKCRRRVAGWGRIGHWQGHQGKWSPSPAPRDEVNAMFEQAS